MIEMMTTRKVVRDLPFSWNAWDFIGPRRSACIWMILCVAISAMWLVVENELETRVPSVNSLFFRTDRSHNLQWNQYQPILLVGRISAKFFSLMAVSNVHIKLDSLQIQTRSDESQGMWHVEPVPMSVPH